MTEGKEQAYPGPNARGLTKREYFAALALQGIEAANFNNESQSCLEVNDVVKRSVLLADMIIAQLNNENA